MIKDQVENFKLLVQRVRGMRLTEAKDLIRSEGCIPRVTSEDGMAYEGKSDARPNRINMDVIDGVVTDSRIG